MIEMLADPQIWASLLTLTLLEVVLGIDNLIFLSILAARLPVAQQAKARRIGLGLALGMRLALLAAISWLIGLTAPLFSVMGHGFSARDLILIGGGLFLVYKGTQEIHRKMEGGEEQEGAGAKAAGFASTIVQIGLLDIVFSLDSVITAVGMANHLPVMMAAVVISIGVMLFAAEPVSAFVHRHPTVKMLALSFLLLIGMTLIADGFGAHVPKGYIYSALGFSILVEVFNLVAAKRSKAAPLTALLLINTKSRRGAEAADTAERALERAGVAVMRRQPSGAAALPDVIRAEARNVDRVIVGGGDGTLNAAAPGVLDTGLPLGILPLGTANDLARTLGLPLEIEAAAAVIAAGQQRLIDVGEVNGHPFFNVASVGFGVDLTRALTRDSKRRWGVLGYAVAAVRTAGRSVPFDVRIVQDGEEHLSRTVHIAVGNGRHYGGGMTVSEHARIDDGRLDIYSLEVKSLWRLLLLLAGVAEREA